MPQISLVAVILIAAANALIFWAIIRSAVASGAETAKRMKHAWAQTELLIQIARRQGVDDATIKSITDGLQHR